MPIGLSLAIERVQIKVEYRTTVMAPIKDTQAIEFRFGSWAISIAKHVNTKNHSVFVNDLA